MTKYKDIKNEIAEVKSRITEAKDEIDAIKDMLFDLRAMLDDNDIRGSARRELKEDISYNKELLDNWYFEKEILYERLNCLYAEKEKLERQTYCSLCSRSFKYSIEWHNIPALCPECRRKFKKLP